jgi:hypothetical protein
MMTDCAWQSSLHLYFRFRRKSLQKWALTKSVRFHFSFLDIMEGEDDELCLAVLSSPLFSFPKEVSAEMGTYKISAFPFFIP